MLTDALIWAFQSAVGLVSALVLWAWRVVLIPALPYAVALCAIVAIRLAMVVRSQPTPRQRKSTPPRIAAVLGSGGHTAEMLTLLSHLGEGYTQPHTYFISSGDELSQAKALKLERERGITDQSLVVTLPRARKVHQSLATTPLSVLYCFAACIYHVAYCDTGKVDLIVLNGPATCVPIVAAVYVRRIFALPSPQLLYVESFARVKTLSLTGNILRHVVDRFVVQWPQGKQHGGAEYHGWLV